MTTERAKKTTASRLDLSGPEWKLWLAAALGAVYTASWFAVERPPPASVRPTPGGPRAAEARPRSVPAPPVVRIRTRSS